MSLTTVLQAIDLFKYSDAQKYNTLPFERNTYNWKWEDKDFPRVQSLLHFEDDIRLNGARDLKTGLIFNGETDPETEILKLQYTNIDYEADPNKHDLHNLRIEDKQYDFAMLNQTIEHLYDPIRCLKNVAKHIRPGGMVYLNAPANNMPHGEPHHFYTGFTPAGIGMVLDSAGFKVKSVGYWGSYHYLELLFRMRRWPDYKDLPHYIGNDIGCPCIVWAWGEKQ